MTTISTILLVILLTNVPFVWYNYKNNNSSKQQVFIWGILILIINFLIFKLTHTKNFYIPLFTTSIFSTVFNYWIIINYIDTKKIPKTIIVLSLFFLSSLLQLIPIYILNYNLDNLTSNQELILTTFSDSVLLIILIIMYFKTLKNDFKKIKGNFYKMMDIGIKYWLIGLIVMMISNILIGIFTKAIAVNEESVQELIKSSSALSIITIGFIAPIIEELTFRKAFRDIFKNDTVFIIMSGLIFGALHVILSFNSIWDLLYIIPYSSLGIAFGKIYNQTNNIYTSIFMHIFHNTVLTILSIIGLGVILI